MPQPTMPISEIPVQGFGSNSKLAVEGMVKDETVDERHQFEMKYGERARACGKEFPWENRGSCTRVRGHILRGENGMHLAGNGEYLVGAW